MVFISFDIVDMKKTKPTYHTATKDNWNDFGSYCFKLYYSGYKSVYYHY